MIGPFCKPGRVGLVAAFLLAASLPVAAQNIPGSWELTGVAGGYFGHQIYQNLNTTVDTATALEYGARFGYNLTPGIGIEGSWTYSNPDLDATRILPDGLTGTIGSLKTNIYEVDGLFSLGTDFASFYVVLGAGATTFPGPDGTVRVERVDQFQRKRRHRRQDVARQEFRPARRGPVALGRDEQHDERRGVVRSVRRVLRILHEGLRASGPDRRRHGAVLAEPMGKPLPVVCMARHGETEWSLSGQHTGLTDLPLTGRGERNARNLGDRLQGRTFARVWSSPLQRATRTCELAGFAATATLDADLVEWNYGEYEGLRTAEILSRRPGWELFRDGCPGGESPQQAAARADRVIGRVRATQGDVLIFSSGHILRMLAARWLGLQPLAGGLFLLGTASLSELGYEHDASEPVIRLWNDMTHVVE